MEVYRNTLKKGFNSERMRPECGLTFGFSFSSPEDLHDPGRWVLLPLAPSESAETMQLNIKE